jgi:prophage tail gpP-like protein
LNILGEQPGDRQDALMRANHEVNLNNLTICEALITVQGWLMDDGSLWCDHLRERITIQSPMLVPTDTFSLLLRGAKHMQDSQNGTTTELNLCIKSGLGRDDQVRIAGLA